VLGGARPAGAEESAPAVSFGKVKTVEIEPLFSAANNSTAGLRLRGQDARQQLLVTARHATGHVSDYTHKVTYQATPEGIVSVNANGLVTALSDGSAKIIARSREGLSAMASITVENATLATPINFPNQIVPIFTKLGCNAGGCHGKASGQNGFRLSLLGFEPAEDYEHLLKESRGRRLFPAAPDNSLLLQKATGALPHGGGKRLEPDSPDYKLLRRWIAQGMPYGEPNDPSVASIEVYPKERVMRRDGQQQLVVIARYSDGSTEDVTRAALYEANDKEIAEVNAKGLVKMTGQPGDVAVMVRYQTYATVFRATVPLGAPVRTLPPARNFIDELAFKKLKAVGLPPSEVCDDATFIRRVTIDIAGRLPTLDEVEQFLAECEGKAPVATTGPAHPNPQPPGEGAHVSQPSQLPSAPGSPKSPSILGASSAASRFALSWREDVGAGQNSHPTERVPAAPPSALRPPHPALRQAARDALIDRLLSSPDYADYFANKWSALLRNKRGNDTHTRGTYAFHAWIRDSLHTNKPFDQFVRELLTASGDLCQNPPVAWYRQVRDATALLEDTAQLLLGTRLKCAQCHHHPFEKWSQQDYFSFAAFFAQVGRKPAERPGEEAIFVKRTPPIATNKKTNEKVKPAALGASPLDLTPDDDARAALADWMTNPRNPFFAKSLVNRYWKHFFNRGIVEPEDDLRDTNPATNPELLDALTQHFVARGYDLKALVRTICRSTLYQLSSLPNQFNQPDKQYFSRYYPKRLTAEVLLDAIDQVTQVPTTFAGLQVGARAVQLPDNSFNTSSYFLQVFARPDASSACECERSQDANLAQSLHLLNSKDLQAKLTADTGRAALLAKDPSRLDGEKIRELYLTALSREPNSGELSLALKYLDTATAKAKPDKSALAKREAYEDLLWAMLSTKEFLFNH
jgi:hypothetical protein